MLRLKKQLSIFNILFGLFAFFLPAMLLAATKYYDLDVDNIHLDGTTISTTNTNGDLTIAPNGTGKLIYTPGTATTVPYLDSSKKLVSSSVTPTQLNLLATATSANTVSTLVERDGSGNFSAGAISASLTGNASTASDLSATLSLAHGGTHADLSATGGTSNVLKQTTTGADITVGQLACADLSNSANSCSTAAASANTASNIVLRDVSGNFSAGTITAALTGNVTGNVSGNITGNLTGNADTATSASKWTTARNLAGNSVDGSANVAFANKFIVQGTTDTGLSAAQFLGALGTGIVKNTTTTGVLSIAVAGDFPTLNQNTSGTAADLSAILSLAHGGTHADLSATGGTSRVLKQTTTGADITVAQLACADLSNSANSCSTTAASANTASNIVLRDSSGNFSAGSVSATQVGVNDTGATSALYVKSSGITVPTATFKAIVSQSADIIQVLDSSGGPQFMFDSGGNFKMFHNVTTPEARFDIRPSVSLTSASTGSAVRYSMFVGQATALATGVGGGIALGGPQTSSTDLTEYGYIWVTKNNATSGDVDTTMHFATRRNSDGKAERVLDMDQAGNSTFAGTVFGTNHINGFTSTATGATTTTLTVASNRIQFFTGATTQTLVMPVATTLVNGQQWEVHNNSSGNVTVQSSGTNTICTPTTGQIALLTMINTAGGTGTASWDCKTW